MEIINRCEIRKTCESSTHWIDRLLFKWCASCDSIRREEDEAKSPIRESYEENPERIETKDNLNQNEND